MIYDLVLAPDPILKKICDPIETVDDAVRKLGQDMLETMYDNKGIGLAASQVGVIKRLLVLDVDQNEEGEKGTPRIFINPEIIHYSDELNTYMEGCLSVPTHYAEVERPKIVRVKFLDLDGKPQEEEIDGLLSTCFQHELDHLNGQLFHKLVSGSGTAMKSHNRDIVCA